MPKSLFSKFKKWEEDEGVEGGGEEPGPDAAADNKAEEEVKSKLCLFVLKVVSTFVFQ